MVRMGDTIVNSEHSYIGTIVPHAHIGPHTDWAEAVCVKKFHQLLAVGRWFPPGAPVSSTRKLISSSSFHRLDMTLAVAEALNP